MHLTKETDYAVRIVYCLAKSKERKDARSISEEISVTLRFSLKILHKLVHSGIVKSYKGAKGGYELARTASDINLRQVIEAIEGNYCLVKCTEPNYVCEWQEAPGLCAFRREFARISKQTNEELEKVTFDRFL